MDKLFKLCKDFFGLSSVCGPVFALRWLFYVQVNLLGIIESGNLRLADLAMGDGPFKVTLKKYKCQFKIMGPSCVSGIREMYARDVYLKDGWLELKPYDTVLDLGANMGNFTNMALAIDPTIRVIAVEPSTSLSGVFAKSVGMNPGHLARTTLIRAILGDSVQSIETDHNYIGADRLTEDELLERANSPRVDFIKCDIEGGEFKLLTRNSKLLAMTRALACEVHANAGDIKSFVENVEACGLTVGPARYSEDGSFLVFLARRSA
jgi:FkbM family methyltransferase